MTPGAMNLMHTLEEWQKIVEDAKETGATVDPLVHDILHDWQASDIAWRADPARELLKEYKEMAREQDLLAKVFLTFVETIHNAMKDAKNKLEGKQHETSIDS